MEIQCTGNTSSRVNCFYQHIYTEFFTLSNVSYFSVYFTKDLYSTMSEMAATLVISSSAAVLTMLYTIQ